VVEEARMEIKVDHVFSRLTGYVPFGILDKVTSYQQPGCWFSKAFQRGSWDGRIRFSKKLRNGTIVIPTGFLTRLTRELDEAGHEYRLYDDRDLSTPEPCYELGGGARLDEGRYAFQGWVLDQALLKGRGIIKMATGSGKSEVGAAIIKSLQPMLKEQGKRALWVTHRGQLALQTQARLEMRLEQKVGLFGYGSRSVEEVTVLMVQSSREYGAEEQKLLNHLVDSCGLIIFDETHHLESDEWYTLAKRVQAPFRFGLTATPKITGAGLGLLAMTEDLLVDIPAWDLVERGVLVPPRIWWIKIEEPRLDRKLHYQTVYKLGITENKVRNNWVSKVAQQFKADGKSCLTLVYSIQHGDMLADLLCKNGVRTEFLSGRDSNAKRLKCLQSLKDGEIDHIVGQVQCWGEGLDVPHVRAIVNATGTAGGGDGEADGEAGRLSKQILGRGLRRAPCKTSVDYVDFLDYGSPRLKKYSRARYNTFKAEGYEPLMALWQEYEPEELVAVRD
jgi:superfamily II DNA or RNA helicase